MIIIIMREIIAFEAFKIRKSFELASSIILLIGNHLNSQNGFIQFILNFDYVSVVGEESIKVMCHGDSADFTK